MWDFKRLRLVEKTMVGPPAHTHLDLGLSRSRNIILQCQSISDDKFVIINIAKVKEKGNVVVFVKIVSCNFGNFVASCVLDASTSKDILKHVQRSIRCKVNMNISQPNPKPPYTPQENC